MLRRFAHFVGLFWKKAYEDNLTGLSGMVAYNLLLSILPVTLLALFIAGRVLQSPGLEDQVVEDLKQVFPSAADATLRALTNRLRTASTEIGIIAVVASVWIGASFWGALDTAFCRIYHQDCRGWVAAEALRDVHAARRAAPRRGDDRRPGGAEPAGRRCGRPAVRPVEHPRRPRRRQRRDRAGAALRPAVRRLLGGPQGPHAVARASGRERSARRWRWASSTTRFPFYLSRVSAFATFGTTYVFIIIVLLWFYAMAIIMLSGAVINALRYELHDTGELSVMNGD